MKIKDKAAIIAMVSVIALTVVTFLIFNFSYYGYIDNEEKNRVEDNFKIVDYIVKNEKDNIERILLEWSNWDDTYEFVNNLNKNYINSNLNDEMLATLNLKMMIFLDDQGNVIFSKEDDLDRDINDSLKEKILFKEQKSKMINGYDQDVELLVEKNKCFFIGKGPITKSRDKTVTNGYLIIIREIDENFLSYIKNLASVNLQINNLEIMSSSYVKDFKTLNNSIKMKTTNYNDKYIEAYKIISDKYSDESIVFSIMMERADHVMIKRYFTIFIVGFLLLVIIILTIDFQMLNKQIFKRLSKLIYFMEEVSITKDTTLYLKMPGNDEFAELANTTNGMLLSLDVAYEEIKEMNKRFEVIMEATNDGYLDFYLQTKEIYISPKWKEFIGCKGENGQELFREYISKVNPECIGKIKSIYHDLISGKIDFYFNEYQVITDSGDIIWVMERGKICERDKNGIPIRLISTISDITKRKKYEQEILYLNYSDRLTGLKNRPFMEMHLNKLDFNKDSRYFIIMGDINGLKLINDSLGHRQGDEILCVVSQIFKDNCQSDDIISRWGGDGFIILVKDKDEKYVYDLIDNIRNNCKSKLELNYNISIALGYAEKDKKYSSTEQVMNLAEKRMYRNKLMQNNSAISSTISTLIKTLHEKHSETEEHTMRIKNLSLKLGKRLGLTQDKIDELELVASLHDIGKIGIPEQILMKPSKLNNEEWEIMKTHTDIGYRIAKSTPQLEHVADEILFHHEKYDGTGYPDGLKGDEIPLVSRIINICDSFDVMTHKRVYKEARNEEYAIKELKRCSGTQFDPYIVKEFLELLKEEKNNSIDNTV